MDQTRNIILVTELQAAFLVQMMVAAQSLACSAEARDVRRNIAQQLDSIYPGVVVRNYGGTLLL